MNLNFLVEELKSIYDPNGGFFNHGKYVPSLAAEIGYVLEHHLRLCGVIEDPAAKAAAAAAEQTAAKEEKPAAKSVNSGKMLCPQCSERELIYSENCQKCLACGYSKCG